MKPARNAMLFAVVFARALFAADADNGNRLARQHCSPCHLVEPNQVGNSHFHRLLRQSRKNSVIDRLALPRGTS
jgi:hypothetical protein